MRPEAAWAVGLDNGLADVKPYNSSIDIRIFDFDAANVAGRRTLPQPRFEGFQQVRCARRAGFHAAIRQVAHPAPKSQLACDADGKESVADPLHLAGYQESARAHLPSILSSFESAGGVPF